MLRVEIDTSNAAFDDGHCEEELRRLLTHVAIFAAAGVDRGPLIDSNGNTVGFWNYQ